MKLFSGRRTVRPFVFAAAMFAVSAWVAAAYAGVEDRSFSDDSRVFSPGYINAARQRTQDVIDQSDKKRGFIESIIERAKGKLSQDLQEADDDQVVPDLKKKTSGEGEARPAQAAVAAGIGTIAYISESVDLGVTGDVLQGMIGDRGQDAPVIITLENGNILKAWKEGGADYAFTLVDGEGNTVINKQLFTVDGTGDPAYPDVTGMTITNISLGEDGRYSTDLRLPDTSYETVYSAAYTPAYTNAFNESWNTLLTDVTALYHELYPSTNVSEDEALQYALGNFADSWRSGFASGDTYFNGDPRLIMLAGLKYSLANYYYYGQQGSIRDYVEQDFYERYISRAVDRAQGVYDWAYNYYQETGDAEGAVGILYSDQLTLTSVQYLVESSGPYYYWDGYSYMPTDGFSAENIFGNLSSDAVRDQISTVAGEVGQELVGAFMSGYGPYYNTDYGVWGYDQDSRDKIAAIYGEQAAIAGGVYQAYEMLSNAYGGAFIYYDYGYGISQGASLATPLDDYWAGEYATAMAEGYARTNSGEFAYPGAPTLDDYVGGQMVSQQPNIESEAAISADEYARGLADTYDYSPRFTAETFPMQAQPPQTVIESPDASALSAPSMTSEPSTNPYFTPGQFGQDTYRQEAISGLSETGKDAALVGTTERGPEGAMGGYGETMTPEDVANLFAKSMEGNASLEGLVAYLKSEGRDIDAAVMLSDILKNPTEDQKIIIEGVEALVAAMTNVGDEDVRKEADMLIKAAEACLLAQAIPDLLKAGEIQDIKGIFSQLNETKTRLILEYQESTKPYYDKVKEDLSKNFALLQLKDILTGKITRDELDRMPRSEIDKILEKIRQKKDRSFGEDYIIQQEAKYRKSHIEPHKKVLEDKIKQVLEGFTKKLNTLLEGKTIAKK